MVKRGRPFTLTLSPSGAFTPRGRLTVKDSIVDFEAPGKGQEVTVTVPTEGLKAFEEAALTITGSAAEFPTSAKVITHKVKMTPLPLSGVKIASYLPKAMGNQKVSLSIVTSDGGDYDPEFHGLFNVRFYSGAQVIGTSPYEQGKEYTVPIPATGRVALKASLAYADDWASGQTLSSPDVFFSNYSNSLPELTVTRKTADTGYPPHTAIFGLAMRGETGNVGSLLWEMSRDGGDYSPLQG